MCRAAAARKLESVLKQALASLGLCSTDIKVLDVALKYEYSSPGSFAKVFIKFHGGAFTGKRKEPQTEFCCSAENKAYIGGWHHVNV